MTVTTVSEMLCSTPPPLLRRRGRQSCDRAFRRRQQAPEKKALPDMHGPGRLALATCTLTAPDDELTRGQAGRLRTRCWMPPPAACRPTQSAAREKRPATPREVRGTLQGCREARRRRLQPSMQHAIGTTAHWSGPRRPGAAYRGPQLPRLHPPRVLAAVGRRLGVPIILPKPAEEAGSAQGQRSAGWQAGMLLRGARSSVARDTQQHEPRAGQQAAPPCPALPRPLTCPPRRS